MTKPKLHPRHILDRVLLNSDLSHKSAVSIKEFMEGNFEKKKLQQIHAVVTEFLNQTYPAKKKKVAKKPSNQFMKKLMPSKELAAVVGSLALPRTTAVSKMWDYVKKHNLQNPKNKRNIICDEKLEKIFLKKEVTMLEMSPLLAKHLT